MAQRMLRARLEQRQRIICGEEPPPPQQKEAPPTVMIVQQGPAHAPQPKKNLTNVAAGVVGVVRGSVQQTKAEPPAWLTGKQGTKKRARR